MNRNRRVEVDHERPGVSRQKIQESLLKVIKQESREAFERKITDEKFSLSKTEAVENLKVSPEAMKAENIEDTKESESEEDEEPSESEEEDEKKKDGCAFLDNEAFDEDQTSENETSSSDDEEVEETSAAPRKSRILKAFEDSDDENLEKDLEKDKTAGDITGEATTENGSLDEKSCSKSQDLIHNPKTVLVSVNYQETTEIRNTEPFATQFPYEFKDSDEMFSAQHSDFTFTEPSVSEEVKTTTGIELLCDSVTSQIIDDELLEICSGQFAPTQQGSSDQAANLGEVSQEAVQEYSQFDSKVDVKSVAEKDKRRLLESSDDEVEEPIERRVRQKKKRKQNLKKLGFYDEDEEDLIAQKDGESSEDLEECEEKVDILYDYDSEENEIEVKTTQKTRVKAGDFVDEEAELSEPEGWGSADEDEKDLDTFEMELGDEDEFDQNKLQEQVGRIHARKVLDDDIRNVKKIEDLLFENEEDDGVGRERVFRWKNQPQGFTLDDLKEKDDETVDDDDFDEESEIAWRKMRHERETMLRELAEQQKLAASQNLTVSGSSSDSSKRNFRMINSKVSPKVAVNDIKESHFLIKMTNMKKFGHSSFLSRDEKTLSNIAKFVSRKDNEVTNFSSHSSSSMSFFTVDKPDESKKRKSDATNQHQQESNKKTKFETSSKKSLLDQL